jgi:hypothetical protein
VIDLLVTGAREGHPFVLPVLEGWVQRRGKPSRLHVGNARGVDLQATRWARRLGVPCDPLEAPWDDLGDAAGMLRNEWLVDEAPAGTVCLGFPVGRSPGTRGCMRLALRKGLPVFCVDLNGVLSPVCEPRDERLGRLLRLVKRA